MLLLDSVVFRARAMNTFRDGVEDGWVHSGLYLHRVFYPNLRGSGDSECAHSRLRTCIFTDGEAEAQEGK